MRRILNRDEYLNGLNRKINLNSVNEAAFANDTNWGDSLLGRLINSFIRKVGVGIDLKKMDNVIKRLKEQFDILKDQIKIKKDSETNIKLFYLYISVLIGKLISQIEDESNNEEELIKAVESTIYEAKFDVIANDDDTKREKEIFIKKLQEFLDFLKGSLDEVKSEESSKPKKDSDIYSSSDVESSEESEISDEYSKDINQDKTLVPGTEIKKIITLSLPPGKTIKNLLQIKNDQDIKNILNIDFSKIPNDKLEDILVKIDNSISVLHNSLISDTVPIKREKSDNSKLKKLFREISKKIHPDKIKGTGLTNKTATEYFQRLNDLNDKKDLEGMKKFSVFIDLILKNIELRKKVVDKLEDLSKRQLNFSKDSDEQLRNKLKNEKYKKHWNKIKEILDKRRIKKDRKENKVLGVIGESLIKNYQRFIFEKLEVKEIREKFDLIFDEEYVKKYQVTKDPSELEKEFESEERSITIDPIIEIVKIFNRAYKLHTPGTIPSGRKSGKVSNRVFRQYEYVGKGSDTARMASDGGVEPGVGPFRNKAIFNKWESAVLDIIKNTEYQEIFNEKTYFHFSPSDPRYNKEEGKKEGGGKSLLKFINALLDGSELYRQGAQAKFIEEYFDVKVQEKELGFDTNERRQIADVADQVKDNVKYKFVKFNTIKMKSIDDYKNLIFKTKSGNDTWYLKVERIISDRMFIIMTNGFPYDLPLSDINIKELSEKGRVWLASSNKDNFESRRIDKKRIEIDHLLKVSDWIVDDKDFSFSSFEVLSNEKGDYFKEDVSMKKDVHKRKIKSIKNLIDSEIERLI